MSLRDQLQTIYDDRGKLTPAILVEEARDESHPLHDRFEWNDAIAGESWRKRQAHDLIVSVRITYRNAKGAPSDVRAFHAVPSLDDDGDVGGFEYLPAEKIAENELLTQLVLRDMERDWKQLKTRYGHFREFIDLVRRDVGEQAS